VGISDARCTREINSRIAMEKPAFSKKKTFHQQTGSKFKEETSEMLQFEHSFCSSKTWVHRKVGHKYRESFEMWW
jgi:hypothetical protein